MISLESIQKKIFIAMIIKGKKINSLTANKVDQQLFQFNIFKDNQQKINRIIAIRLNQLKKEFHDLKILKSRIQKAISIEKIMIAQKNDF